MAKKGKKALKSRAKTYEKELEEYIKALRSLPDLDVSSGRFPDSSLTFVVEPQVNYITIRNRLSRSPTFSMITNTLIRHCVARRTPLQMPIDIVPSFFVKCSHCGVTFDHIPDDHQHKVDGKLVDHNVDDFEVPDPAERERLLEFLKKPDGVNSVIKLFESHIFYRSMLDEIIYFLERKFDARGVRFVGVRLEDPADITPVVDKHGRLGIDPKDDVMDEKIKSWFCPLNSEEHAFTNAEASKIGFKCSRPHIGETGTPIKRQIPLEKTAYIQIGDSDKIIARFSEVEIYRTGKIISPFVRYIPRTAAAWIWFNILDAQDMLNYEIANHGQFSGFVLFKDISELEMKRIRLLAEANMLRRRVMDPKTGRMRPSLKNYLHWAHAPSAEASIEKVNLMDDFNKTQSLDFYELYRDELFGSFGVMRSAAGQQTKSNPKALFEVMEVTVSDIQGEILDAWNHHILPALGFKDWVFDFPSLEKKDKFRDAQTFDLLARAVVNLEKAGFITNFENGEFVINGKRELDQGENGDAQPEGETEPERRRRRRTGDSDRTGGDTERPESRTRQEEAE